jgi:Diadenosine tetraphosphate (Ap4A) hydrolase and other HIT family hydrolases
MNTHFDPSCIFCKIIARQVSARIIAETDALIAIEDSAPKAPTHYLIIPKEHVRDIQSLMNEQFDYMAEIGRIAQQLALCGDKPQDFKLVINSGFNAGQRVFHLHAHYLSGDQLPGLV